MTQNELRDKFNNLYMYMSTSKEPKYMMLFGDVMREMMEWMIANRSESAEAWIDTLCSIKWTQYLTKHEAMSIYNAMNPKGAWGWEAWKKAMEEIGLETKRDGIFNEYALWIVMNGIESDQGLLLDDLLGLQPNDATNEKFIRVVHKMALNLLEDKDKKYDVRKYFLDK